MSDKALAWGVGGDTGISSLAIWAHMMGQPVNPEWGGPTNSAPCDPDDFGRCYRLLALIPAWRSRIAEMTAYGSQWSALAGAWDELQSLYELEIDRGGPRHRGTARRLYVRMTELRYPKEPSHA